MNSIDDVYRAFGFTAEAGQLLETELGTILLQIHGESLGLLTGERPEEARAILESINRSTLGQVIKKLQATTDQLEHASEQLAQALAERNRLVHSFFRQHNNRRNSEEGRAVMLADLESMHAAIFAAYKLVLKISGVDLNAISSQTLELPTRHLRLD
jgi:hypothetical protein